jgi:hypothetical protein
MQLEVYSFSLEERYHQNTVSLFFESLLKLSEGREIKKCWITQRWKRSMSKKKRVLTNHELYFSAQKDVSILYLPISFAPATSNCTFSNPFAPTEQIFQAKLTSYKFCN